MSQQIIIPVLIAFVITAVLGPVVIPVLKKLKVGQTEREELKSHLKKAGTPTMGGLMILAGIVVTLYQGLSGNYAYFVCDGGLWNYWFPG